MRLVIGDKFTSTWSLRPWLVLKRMGVAFEEVSVKLRQPDTADAIARWSPSARVPVLIDGDSVVWDSLAICEYLAETHPDRGLWPADAADRALARSACAEMHAGFQSLRGEFSMDLNRTPRAHDASEATAKDIRRIVNLWCGLRKRRAAAGPFLFGEWSMADAYFTPVATRFHTYGQHLGEYGDEGLASEYASSLLAQPEFLEWREGARVEGGGGDD